MCGKGGENSGCLLTILIHDLQLGREATNVSFWHMHSLKAFVRPVSSATGRVRACPRDF